MRTMLCNFQFFLFVAVICFVFYYIGFSLLDVDMLTRSDVLKCNFLNVKMPSVNDWGSLVMLSVGVFRIFM